MASIALIYAVLVDDRQAPQFDGGIKLSTHIPLFEPAKGGYFTDRWYGGLSCGDCASLPSSADTMLSNFQLAQVPICHESLSAATFFGGTKAPGAWVDQDNTLNGTFPPLGHLRGCRPSGHRIYTIEGDFGTSIANGWVKTNLYYSLNGKGGCASNQSGRSGMRQSMQIVVCVRDQLVFDDGMRYFILEVGDIAGRLVYIVPKTTRRAPAACPRICIHHCDAVVRGRIIQQALWLIVFPDV